MDSSYINIFERYFSEQFWGNRDGSSGPNSAFQTTAVVRENLQKLLTDYAIDSICDAGCGDCNLFRYIDISEIKYNGVECVSALTAQNQQRFSDQSNMHFHTLDVVSDPLPRVDLIISRDVVHYLPNALVQRFLDNCQKSGSRYLLITHNTHAPQSANTETQAGIFRPVNLTQAPFSWPVPITTIKEDTFAKEMALYELNS